MRELFERHSNEELMKLLTIEQLREIRANVWDFPENTTGGICGSSQCQDCPLSEFRLGDCSIFEPLFLDALLKAYRNKMGYVAFKDLSINDPVFISRDGKNWTGAHFSHYDNESGKVFVFKDGRSSHSIKGIIGIQKFENFEFIKNVEGD